jgi:hypothetical protein
MAGLNRMQIKIFRMGMKVTGLGYTVEGIRYMVYGIWYRVNGRELKGKSLGQIVEKLAVGNG